MSDGKDRPGLSWVQVVAGAGAAVSSALLLSTLGVSGTIAGAAVGSVVASLASHTYTRGLSASREQALALRRVAQAREDLDRVATHPDEDVEAGLEHADKALGRVEATLQRPQPPRMSWKHVALVAAGLFVAVMVGITAFELVTGRAVSVRTGGSDNERRTTILGGEDKPKKKATQTPTPSQTPSQTTTQTTTPSVTPTPSETPSQTPTSSPTETAPTPTLTPTESPTATAPATAPATP